jgi:hypothetical protein
MGIPDLVINLGNQQVSMVPDRAPHLLNQQLEVTFLIIYNGYQRWISA